MYSKSLHLYLHNTKIQRFQSFNESNNSNRLILECTGPVQIQIIITTIDGNNQCKNLNLCSDNYYVNKKCL